MDKEITRLLTNDMKTAAEVTSLILDGNKFDRIQGLTEEFTNLKLLSLNGLGLTSLQGLPKLPRVDRIILDYNELEGGLEHLVNLENCTFLRMESNNIINFDELMPLKEMTSLKWLFLDKNPLVGDELYFWKVFDLLPQVVYLDNMHRCRFIYDYYESSDEGDGQVLLDQDENAEEDNENVTVQDEDRIDEEGEMQNDDGYEGHPSPFELDSESTNSYFRTCPHSCNLI